MLGRALGWLVTRLLPRRLQLAFFGGLAVLLYALGVRRRVVRSNLRLAFPEKSEEERRAIALATYRRLGQMIPEFLRVPYLSRAELEELFEYQNWDRFMAALAEGRGLIACTAHLGNFDLLAAAQNLRGVPTTIVARELRFGLWRGARDRAGVETLYVRQGETLSATVRALRAGRVLGYVIDQSEPNRSAVYPTFFGIPVATSATPAVLARRTGAPVVFVISLSLPGGRHRVVVEGPLHPPDTGDRERDVLAFMQDLNDRLERWVRAHPEQWYWLHRRWKRTRPPAGAPAAAAASPPAAEPPASH